MSSTPPPEVLAGWAQLANPFNPQEVRGMSLPIATIVLLILCFIVVSLRIYIRVFQTKNFGWDDGLIIFNLVGRQRLSEMVWWTNSSCSYH